MNERELLFQVLDIIEYQDNKQEFINTFYSLIYLEALEEITTKLNPELQKKLENELREATDEEAKKKLLLTYFSQEDFEQQLILTSQAQFREYLETVLPTLSHKKQEELTTYLSTLPKPQ